MRKVAIHASYGSFYSPDFETLGCGHKHLWGYDNRDCPVLIERVLQMGPPYMVVEVPDDARWYVDEYDGFESVREGRVWPEGGYGDGKPPTEQQTVDEEANHD